MPRLRPDAIAWLVAHPEVLDLWDGSREQRLVVLDAMKAAGVIRKETGQQFIRVDLYVETAMARRREQ